jgi:hypothetical protein
MLLQNMASKGPTAAPEVRRQSRDKGSGLEVKEVTLRRQLWSELNLRDAASLNRTVRYSAGASGQVVRAV